MTNLLTNLIIAVFFTNTTSLEVKHPSGFSEQDHTFVTNITYVQVAVPELGFTNSMALSTNVHRYVWAVAPLRLPRSPYTVRDSPPLPPGPNQSLNEQENH